MSVDLVMKSIEQNGVLDNNFWLVMELSNGDSFKYHIINCNHRFQAFKQLGIKEARALVFAKLEKNIYNLIADIYIT